MNPKPLLLLVALAVLADDETVCLHPSVGAVRRISVEEVRKAHGAVLEKLRFSWEASARLTIDRSFDSGLPACVRRERRTVAGRYARDLAGRTIAFARADRMPKADLRVATAARRLADLEVDAVDDPALRAALGIRCAPTVVRVVSEVELELLEGD